MDVREADFTTIGGLMDALYRAISGPPGGQDFGLFRRAVHADLRMVRTGIGGDGRPTLLSMSADDYVANAGRLLAGMAFYEIETARRIVRFGNVAQVYSAYEARTAPDGGDLIKRGLNFGHLFHDGARWWLMHLIWDDERAGVTVPGTMFDAWEDVN
jgi:hypothetical protein